MSKSGPITAEFQPPHGSVASYIFGFSASVLLTLGAYVLAVTKGSTRSESLVIIALLAATQCTIQLICFLHVGHEFKPRWKLLAFGLMLLIVTIVVGGSLWIMGNLNSHMQYTPQQMVKYANGQDGL